MEIEQTIKVRIKETDEGKVKIKVSGEFTRDDLLSFVGALFGDKEKEE